MAASSDRVRGSRLAMGALAFTCFLGTRPAHAFSLEDWPCPGCTTVVPGDGSPRPLLVALHGDGGATKPIVRAFRDAAKEASAILLVPSCPRDKGCRSASFWKWLETSQHDPAWLGAQIDAVVARFAVDPRRVYATGYSGGATYLGWYVPAFPLRFAAVAYVAGGAPYRPPCPSCKVPVSFLIGATDPMIGPFTRPLRDWYEACGGHEIVWEVLPGVTHESIVAVLQAGRARSVVAWLMAHPAACVNAVALDAGAPAPPILQDASSPLDAGALPAIEFGETPKPPPQAIDGRGNAPAPPREPPPPARCACAMASGGTAGELTAIAGVVLTAIARRRRPRR